MPDGMISNSCAAHLNYSSFMIHFSLFIKIKTPLEYSKGVSLRGTTLFRIAVQCLFDALTGAPGNGYLSTFRLRDHVRRPSPARFQLPGLSVRFCAVTLPILAFSGIVRLIIAIRDRFCQPFFPATPKTSASTGSSGQSRPAHSPVVSSTFSPGRVPTGSRAVKRLPPQRTRTKRFSAAPGRLRSSSTWSSTVPIIISIPPFGGSLRRFRRGMRESAGMFTLDWGCDMMSKINLNLTEGYL